MSLLRGSFFVALLFAGVASAVADPSDAALRFAIGASAPDATFNRPIDLNTGFRPPQRPPASEDAALPLAREPEGPGAPESFPRAFGLPRAGVPGMMSKREHVATFRLQGVTLFGGSVAGDVDGRSAHLLLSWPTGD
jgi:hypothetical protein